MNKTWIIARNVFMKNAKTISFWVMIILPIIFMLFSFGIGFLSAKTVTDSTTQNDSTKIAVITQNAQTKEALKAVNQDFEPVNSIDEATSQLKGKKVQAYVDFDQINNLTIVTSGANNDVQQKLSAVVMQAQNYLKAKQAGISDQQLATLSQPSNVQFKDVNDDENLTQAMSNPDTKKTIYTGVATGSVVIIFVILMAFANIMAQEIGSEKGTRIMEVLVSSAPAKQHYYGKIIGVLMMIAIYMGVYSLIGAGTLFYFRNNEIGSAILNQVVLTPFFGFIIAFLIIAVIYGIVLAAIFGSMASKSEDAPKMVAPVTYIVLVGYLVGLVTANGNNILTQILSYIPFLSSFIAPSKIGLGFMNSGLGFLSLGISVVVLILVTYFGAKLYASNVLMYSEQSVWKRLLNSIKFLNHESKVKD